MIVSGNHPFVASLLKALGLECRKVISLKLEVRLNEAMVVTVEQYAEAPYEVVPEIEQQRFNLTPVEPGA